MNIEFVFLRKIHKRIKAHSGFTRSFFPWKFVKQMHQYISLNGVQFCKEIRALDLISFMKRRNVTQLMKKESKKNTRFNQFRLDDNGVHG